MNTNFDSNINFQVETVKEEGNLSIYEFQFTENTDKDSVKEESILHWSFPIKDICGMWHADCGMNRGLEIDEEGKFTSMTTSSAPLISFYSASSENRYTLCLSCVKEEIRLSAGVHEEDGCIHVRFYFSKGSFHNKKVLLRIDTGHHSFSSALMSCTKWWESMGILPAVGNPASFSPVYSTWYAFHQNIDDATLERECQNAVSLGMKTIIVDDGWQTKDNNRGYAFCGDWEVEESKFPDFPAHIDRVHKLGMKYMLWFSVPFIGKYAKVFDQFSDKLLYFDEMQGAGVLDPRYPELREYLIKTYEGYVRQGVDGLKLDFVNEFYDREGTKVRDGMDIPDIQDAVDFLLSEVRRRVSLINPEIMIEFRQPYIGPNMRMYGDFFRASDCPYSELKNRVRTIDLRLLSGETAVHSDMLMWHPEEAHHAKARQIINVIFSVVQFSIRLADASEEDKALLSFWISYMRDNEAPLYHGDFTALEPQNLYPIAYTSDEKKAIYAMYTKGRVLDLGEHKEIDILNAADSKEMFFRSEKEGQYMMESLDCFGKQVSKTILSTHAGNVYTLPIEKGGLVKLSLQC